VCVKAYVYIVLYFTKRAKKIPLDMFPIDFRQCLFFHSLFSVVCMCFVSTFTLRCVSQHAQRHTKVNLQSGWMMWCLRVVKNRVAGFKQCVNNPEVSKVNVTDAARAFTAVIAGE